MLTCEICGSEDVRQMDEGILCMKCKNVIKPKKEEETESKAR